MTRQTLITQHFFLNSFLGYKVKLKSKKPFTEKDNYCVYQHLSNQ